MGGSWGAKEHGLKFPFRQIDLHFVQARPTVHHVNLSLKALGRDAEKDNIICTCRAVGGSGGLDSNGPKSEWEIIEEQIDKKGMSS